MSSQLSAAAAYNADAALSAVQLFTTLQQKQNLIKLKHELPKTDIVIEVAVTTRDAVNDILSVAAIHFDNRNGLAIEGHIYKHEERAPVALLPIEGQERRCFVSLKQPNAENLEAAHKVVETLDAIFPNGIPVPQRAETRAMHYTVISIDIASQQRLHSYTFLNNDDLRRSGSQRWVGSGGSVGDEIRQEFVHLVAASQGKRVPDAIVRTKEEGGIIWAMENDALRRQAEFEEALKRMEEARPVFAFDALMECGAKAACAANGYVAEEFYIEPEPALPAVEEVVDDGIDYSAIRFVEGQ